MTSFAHQTRVFEMTPLLSLKDFLLVGGRAFLLLLYAVSVATAEPKDGDLHFVAVLR
jgi:hypothetical protein